MIRSSLFESGRRYMRIRTKVYSAALGGRPRHIPCAGVGVVGVSTTSVYVPAWLHEMGRRPRARRLLRRCGFVVYHDPVVPDFPCGPPQGLRSFG
jgi:hypothetical protein